MKYIKKFIETALMITTIPSILIILYFSLIR